MANGNRGKGVAISKKSLSKNAPSMHAPGDGSVRRPIGNANVFGGERHASAFADAQSNIGGAAKDESSRKRYLKE